ncbi:uncharacterized protein LOC124281310 [Haliotis rubra]|uniref:uncharacterized protein LOC124281310 n=1 Tax=Haliotis rubra TaxID=36100 RepID=UPI001EE51283|nr:uncharacterized protein LOC124281310 [Haliotis rubra]
MVLLNSSMNMWRTVCMYVVLLAVTQSYGTSAFRGLDFAGFKGPNFAPDDFPDSNLQQSSFSNRLRDIEERFDAVTSMESRLDDIEQRLEESKTNDTDAKEIKTKMETMEGELETVQDTLSALSAVANNVEKIQATVAASSVKNEQDKQSLVGTLATTRGRVAAIEAEVVEMKSKLNTNEGNFQKLNTGLNRGDRTHDVPQQRGK